MRWIQDTLPGIDEQLEITHECPGTGEFYTRCCHKTIFDLPRADRMTLDSSLVNCKGII